jgi:hypothetical protein
MVLICSSGGRKIREGNVCSSWEGWYGSLSLGWLIFGKLKDSPKNSLCMFESFQVGPWGVPLR